MFLYTEVLANGDISFYRKVSSEAEWDYLRFYIDFTLMGEWSGELNWEMVSFPVSEGLHTFRWVYEKDPYVSTGEDCAWIDYIVLPPVDITTYISSYEIETGELDVNIIPNPARSSLNINYNIGKDSNVEMVICDIAGHEVMKVFENNSQKAGTYTWTADVSGLKSGLYFCLIRTSYSMKCQKLIIQ